MRILMLSSSWPLHDGDFRGGFVQELALELASRGICVDVAVPAPQQPVAVRPLADGMVVVHWLPSLLPIRSSAFHGDGMENNILRHPLSAFSLPPTLAAFAAECSMMLPFVDAVVSNWLLPMGAVGAALSALSGRPHLVIAHSGPPVPAAIPPISLLVRKIVSQSASVACVSESVMRDVKRVVGQSGGRFEVIELGVPIRPFVEVLPAEGAPLRLLFVGRIVSIKGLDVLIRAMRGLTGCRLVVVGDGPARRSMEALAGLLGVDVKFQGAVDRDEVRGYMGAADLLVVPSRRGIFGRQEGMPRVIGEAWSSGLPVVASRSGGMGEAVLRTGAGVLFEPGDVRSLAAVLRQLVRDQSAVRRMRERALAAASGLAWQNTGARWAAWIESTLNGHG